MFFMEKEKILVFRNTCILDYLVFQHALNDIRVYVTFVKI